MEIPQAEPSNESLTIKRPSSLDLILARNLDRVSQIYRTELLPGEVRVWQKALWGVKAETVERAFAEYFQVGKFPPKPVDIYEIIKRYRETPTVSEFHGLSASEREAAAASRKAFFESAEYREIVAKLNREYGL